MTTFPPSAHIDRSEQALVVTMAGELDADGVALVASPVLRAPQRGDHLVQVDVHAVTFCGAAGLGLLLELHRRVVDLGGQLHLRRPSPAVVRVLRLCGLDDVLPAALDQRPDPADQLQLAG